MARYRREVVREVREQARLTQAAVQELAERIAVRRAESELVELTTGKRLLLRGVRS